MARPLEGLRVLDLSRLLPGPFATLLLADLGADVVKVEDTQGGDYARYYPPLAGGGPGAVSAIFAALNRDKRSVALNLKRPEAVEALRRLAVEADVLVESFRPGVMARLGVGPEQLRAVNPRLIYCAISGYGQTGPLAHRAGHDLNYLALAGVAALTGRAGEVVPPGFQAADVAGGSLFAVVGILAALHERARTGEGRLVDASMTDGVAGLAMMVHARQFSGGAAVGPGDDDLAGARLCYRPWRCADGRALAVGALEPKFWGALCQAIGRPDLFGDGFAEGERKARVEAELAAVFAAKTRDEWVALLASHDVCVEPVLDPAEARQSEHARARGLFGTHRHEGAGAEVFHQYPNPRLLPGAEPPATPRPSPGLGEHTSEVLRAAGYDDDALRALVAAGAIAGPGLP